MVASSRQGAVPPPSPRTLPPQLEAPCQPSWHISGKGGGLSPPESAGTELEEGATWRSIPPSWPQEAAFCPGQPGAGVLAGGGVEGLIIRDGPSKYRLQLNHLGGLFWVRLPQSCTLSLAHTGTKKHVVTHGHGTQGAHRRWGSHTEGLTSHADA